MASTIKIAVGQMCSSSNLKTNARVVSKIIDQALKANAKVLFLPEAADYLSRDASHSIQLAERTHAEFISPIREKIRSIYHSLYFEKYASPVLESDPDVDPELGLYVAVGIHEPAEGKDHGSKVRNNQIWISNKGEVLQRYQKIHLFDVNITNGPILQESASVVAGTKITEPFPIAGSVYDRFKVGFAICYDLRFPEMALFLRGRGANILTYPSAFTTKTGEAHWKELGRARAIDSQCYVVMAAQSGYHDVYADVEVAAADKSKKRVSYGQSLIIGPWGEVISEGSTYMSPGTGDEDGDIYELVVGDLDLDHLDRIRTDLPVFEHRRENYHS